MLVLLDEQLPRHLARDLTGHQVRTVQQEGWARLKNGELLQRAADSGFDVFVTADQNLEFQQNLSRARLGVVVLRSSRDEAIRAGRWGSSLSVASAASQSRERIRVCCG